MGCTASKLENEDTVRRCKERRRLMKEAVYSRHHLAAAHSDYCRYLRLTGSALVTFASGEPLPVSHHTPAVLLRTPSSTTAASTIKPPSYHPSPSVHHQTPPPPTPTPPISTTSSHRRREQQPPQPPPPRRKHPIPVKLPHILSDSSFTSSPPRNQQHNNFTYDARANSTFSETASQTSSVWNWDNFYPPPSPPDSEYFHNLNSNNREARNHSDSDEEGYAEDDRASSFTSYSNSRAQTDPNRKTKDAHQPFDEMSSYSRHSDISHRQSQKVNSQSDRSRNHFGKTKEFDELSSYSRQSDMSYKQGHNKSKKWESEEEEEETEREEVQCSEWGDHDHDHYSSTSSSTDEDEEGDLDLKSRSDFGSMKKEPANVGNVRNMDSVSFKASSKSEKVSVEEDGKSSFSWGNRNDVVSERRMVVRHKDLREIVEALKEYFDKAAAAGEQVSEMLEIGRAQIDRSFKQLRKTVYHSSGMLSNLSSTWTSKPPLAVKYKFEPSSIEQTGGPKSLSCTLERLFAWEKKLYDEVKTREGVKIEHEKKLSALQNQEYRGEENSKVDKTKASINRLHSLIAVTSQAVSTTSSAIVGTRDSDLVPQLVELCHGFMYMWRSMNQYHEIQNDIVQQVRGLVNRAAKGESTSDLHRQATRDLESAVTAWHTSFCRLIKFQRDFIRSLHGWFKLTLLPVNAEPTTENHELSEVFTFCDEWKLALDRVPDTVASEAIKSFINVVHSIVLKQTEEVKIRKRTETVSKELEKKASSLRNIEKKYYHSYSMVGIGLPDTGPDNGHALDARDPLAEKKLELSSCQRRVEDEMLKHAKAVEVTRAMTLNNIQTGLPGVFQAMTSFSSLITEALGTVCTRSYAI